MDQNDSTENLDVTTLHPTSEDDLTLDGFSEELNNFEKIKEKKFEVYKIILDTRKFEIDNFWKRTTFFWGTLALIAVGYFNAKGFNEYLIFISYIGFFYNLIFSISLRGSKYWQEYWEVATNGCERALRFKLFGLKDRIDKQIEKRNAKVFCLFRPKRKSVSKITMLLSDITILFWIVLIYRDFKKLIEGNFIFFDFNLRNDFHFFTLLVLIPPVLFFIYFLTFWNVGTDKEQV